MLDAERSLELLDRVGEGILSIGIDGRIDYLNRTAEQLAFSLFGLPIPQLLHREIWDALPQLVGTRFEREVRRVMAQRGEVEFEEALPPQNRWFAVRVAATDRGVLCCLRDIAEQKAAQQALVQAQKMEAVGRLAGGVAHDFNNMMMIIFGFSEFLLSSLPEDDVRRADAEEIRKAADRAQHLTRQLLSFGRQQLVARGVVRLNEIVGGLERMLRPILGENIQLTMDLAANPGAVEADHGQLEQIVMNLALNARDAMRGGGRLKVETFDAVVQGGSEMPAGAYVALRVSDTGHGMTSEVKDRLFEPFFTTKPTDRNTGLGLATVYGIVVQSAGYIWVDSEVGKGAVFSIYLPRAMDEDIVAVDAAPIASPAGGSETILLVEDEPSVRTLARRALMNQGYRVIEAADGREALDVVARSPLSPDLILTDVVMPELGGQELVHQLVALYPGLRIVYMTGYTESEKLLPVEPDASYSFLHKPFSPESLALTIREALDREAALPT